MFSWLHTRANFNDTIDSPLSQAVGYVVVVGVGLIIAFGMLSSLEFLQQHSHSNY
jgi:hypothetical protein